jgi:heme-degrading monooxygenase HmoA
MIVAIFRARVHADNADEYYALADEMGAIAKSMPGFISWKGYFADDGERVSIHEWETAAALEAWRNHPEHLRVQALGREKFYDEYTLCDGRAEGVPVQEN